MEKLLKIQQTLKAPKNQRNNFGGFNYRSCEDILEAVKPLLDGAILTLNDEIVLLGNRFYVKATATFIDGDFQTSTTAFAREPDTKKGMDEPQITGTASSYARKYALNGLFLIDDQKDADTNEYKKQTTPAKPKNNQTITKTKPNVNDNVNVNVNENNNINNNITSYCIKEKKEKEKKERQLDIVELCEQREREEKLGVVENI